MEWVKKHKVLTVILVIVALAIISAATGGGKQTNNSNTGGSQNQNSNTQTEQPKVAEKITAAQLADDFDANQVAAETKWKDKYVEFSAAISNINDSGISFHNVGSKEFSMTQISCRITNKSELQTIQNGQQITVRGTVGGQTFGVIDLKDCSIV